MALFKVTRYYVTGSEISSRELAALLVRRPGDQEERSGRDKEQSETENNLGQTRHHRRDVKLTDVEMEAVVGASVRRAG